jgi:hypothetical protein
LVDPGPKASGVVETGVWTADNQPVAFLAKSRLGGVQVGQFPLSAARDKGHVLVLLVENKDRAAAAAAIWDGTFYYHGVSSLRRCGACSGPSSEDLFRMKQSLLQQVLVLMH